ncbi:hypothetical protein C8R43DRAFT_970811 [Mycena crocata]|nr:hypothetical protein C8R43DRAFT_970811 [Mycena crocata]
MSKPTYLYKLCSPMPDPLPEVLPLSELDAVSGFMHFSTAVQVPRTLKRFFADKARVDILRINYAAVEQNSDLRWEDSKGKEPGEIGGEGVFAHIYGRSLTASDIETVVSWHQTDGNWDEALKKAESWLVY